MPAALSVATYNIGRTGTAADLAKLADAGVTVICLQEMSDRRGIRLPDGWGAYWPDDEPGQAATPIIFDARSLPVASGSRLMTPATDDLEDGAGGSSVKAKWANWVTLQPDGSEPVTVIPVHAIPTVQGRNGPIGSKPKRVAWHARHMDALANLAAEHFADGLVIVAGDFNVAYNADSINVDGWPVRMLATAGLACTFSEHGKPSLATHDNRNIDYIFGSRPATGHRVLSGYGSDHRPLLATYELAELPKPEPVPEPVPEVVALWTAVADLRRRVRRLEAAAKPEPPPPVEPPPPPPPPVPEEPTVPRLTPASLTLVRRARAGGIVSPIRALLAARKAGLGFPVACSLLMQESSGGHNVFGSDDGQPFEGAGEVTRAKYRAYLLRRNAGEGAQGVGPTQLTWPGYQDMADKLGGCWKPSINMRVGFGIVRGYLDAGEDLRTALRRYNGTGPRAEAYADEMMVRVEQWRGMLS